MTVAEAAFAGRAYVGFQPAFVRYQFPNGGGCYGISGFDHRQRHGL